MALGESSKQLCLYPNIMKPTKDFSTKKIRGIAHDSKTSPIEEHSSLLFAMRSAFREKLAIQMNANAQAQKNRSKHKQVDNENSLLQLCEKNKKLMRDYNENSKENPRRKIASDHTNRMKKLPPIPHQNRPNTDSNAVGYNHGTVESGYPNTYQSKLAVKKQHHSTSPLKNNGYNTMANGKNKLSSISSNSTYNRQLDDSTPDITKLRIVRNKRKHELMKVNTKHSSPVNMMDHEDSQVEVGASKPLVQDKPSERKHQNLHNSVAAVKSTSTSMFDTEYESDFQKWQKERDQDRQTRLSNLSDANSSSKGFHAVSVKPKHPQPLEPEFKQFSTKPLRKNVKRRQERVSLSPQNMNNFDTLSAYPKNNQEINFTKPMGASPEIRATKMNSKSMADPLLNPASVIPGLHRPVLVRHEGRSNASSRTSTRNAFNTHSKIVPPMEGERETLEKIPKTESHQMFRNSTKGTYTFDSNSTVIPEQEENVVLVPCRICRRKFRTERIDKHVSVCAKSSTKKRKVFNMSKARKKGTDLEKFTFTKGLSSRQSQPQPRKSNWRSQHEDFIKTIRHAKMVTSYVKGGGNLTDLPPPEPSANPDYVSCEYCKRRFAPHVAERHIAKCKNIKARPPPPKSRVPRNKQ